MTNSNYLCKQGSSSNKHPDSSCIAIFVANKDDEEIQLKCEEFIPCEVSGESLYHQRPKTGLNHLPPIGKPNQKTQLDFIRPNGYEHRRFSYLNQSSVKVYDQTRALANLQPDEKPIFFITKYSTKRNTTSKLNR